MYVYKTKDFYVYDTLASMDIFPFNQEPDGSFLYEKTPELMMALSII